MFYQQTKAERPARITAIEIQTAADALGVPATALKAVMKVECRSSGFNRDGTAVILFEPHVLYRELGKVRYYMKRNQLGALFPDICTVKWNKRLYNVRPSYEKLMIAAALHWDAAHASASWGLGQVMGAHWESLGYASMRDFVEAMQTSEAHQLDAMCRFIRVNGLIDEIQRQDWRGFALHYNGPGYEANQYHLKLAAAYKT